MGSIAIILLTATALNTLTSTLISARGFRPWRSLPLCNETEAYDGSYLILGPQTFQYGRPYTASVNLLKKFPGSLTVTMGIMDSKNKTIAQAKKVIANPSAGKLEKIQIDNIPPNLDRSEDYRLFCKGESGDGKLLFEDKDQIHPNLNPFTVFIQTDKAKYKPGSLVRYRVLVVKPDLKPYDGFVDIRVVDPEGNVIKKSDKKQLSTGVYGDQFQLSAEPPLGSWNIEAKVLNKDGEEVEENENSKDFDVEKYVLPKFKVSLKVPDYGKIGEDLVIKITAKYTYGKGLRGKATAKCEEPYPRYIYDEEDYSKPPKIIRRNPIIKTVALDGTGTAMVTCPFAELVEMKLLNTSESYNSVRVRANVTEALTGIERDAGSGYVSYRKVSEQMDIQISDNMLKPGMKFTVLINVTTLDKQPLPPDASKAVFLNVTYDKYRFYNGTDYVNYTTEQYDITLETDGSKKMEFVAPLADHESMNIEANYGSKDSQVTGYGYGSFAESPTDTYIQLRRADSNGGDNSVAAGDKIPFTVKTSKGSKLPSVTMQVISKSRVLQYKNIKLSDEAAKFEVETTSEMAPRAQVIVYGIRPDNSEIVAAEEDFTVTGMLQNKVELSFVPDKAEPYDENGKKVQVELRTKADPGSYVGLLAVDESVKLLASGNDITYDQVEGQLGWGYGGYYGFRALADRRKKRDIIWGGHRGGVAASIFSGASLVTMTDAYLYRGCVDPDYDDYDYESTTAAGDYDEADDGPGDYDANGEGGGGGPPGSEAASRETSVTVRKDFPEVWIWADMSAGADGTAVYKAEVPDTITSWVASAFAMNDKTGIGVAPENAKLQVFRNFFIRMNLPYSVKQGEKLALQILVYNYGDSAEDVTVELDHSKESGFDFIKKSKGGKKDKNYNVRKIKVDGNGGTESIRFPIIPTKIGEIKLLVKAIGGKSKDAVERKLLVEPEGVRLFFNKPLLIDFAKKSNGNFKQIVDMSPPKNIAKDVIPGSGRAQVSIIGDIMGPLLNNLDDLVRMPYGCGEQNIAGLVPNIVVRKYLEAAGGAEKHKELMDKTEKYMESGYQRQLKYKHEDGSYSAFGEESDGTGNGSTWLTAFVVRSFAEAKPYIFIDDKIMDESVGFLLEGQQKNGTFVETGLLFNTGLQGGSGASGVPMTAYVAIALMKAGKTNKKAIKFIENNLDKVKDDPYALAIALYALQQANSPKKGKAYKMLQAKVIKKDGMRYWKGKVKKNEKKLSPWWYWGPQPVDVEVTSYAIMSEILKNNAKKAFPSIRWLSKQRNSLGGFASTQDTVMGISAIGAYAEKTYAGDTQMAVDASQSDTNKKFKVDPDNAIVLQKMDLSDLSKPVTITAKGKGSAFAQVAWHYNVPELAADLPFMCTKKVSEKNAWSKITVDICCKYNQDGKSNMAVIEVEAPSGYDVDEEELNKLPAKTNDLQRVEVSNYGSKAILYFNSFGSDPVCSAVTSERSYGVADHKPSQIKVYDYYEPSKMVQLEYSIKSKSIEDECEDCW